MSCCNKSINLITGSGSINTLYSADGSLLATRTVTMGGNSLTLNGTKNLTYTDAGRLTLSLYQNGLDDQGTFYPRNFLYSDSAGQVLSAPLELTGMLNSAGEVAVDVAVSAFALTLVDTTSAAITITPPTGVVVDGIFALSDSRANASTNNITVSFTTTGEKFHGSVQDFTMNSNAAYAQFRFMGGAIGWIVEK